MKYYRIYQNNSGGYLKEPARMILVEAPDWKSMQRSIKEYVTFCGEEYDWCGCCSCCGHRWDEPWSRDGYSPESILQELNSPYNNTAEKIPSFLLIYADGNDLLGDTPEKVEEIRAYFQSLIPVIDGE